MSFIFLAIFLFWIFYVYPLANVYLKNIFSHSVGFLITGLILFMRFSLPIVGLSLWMNEVLFRNSFSEPSSFRVLSKFYSRYSSTLHFTLLSLIHLELILLQGLIWFFCMWISSFPNKFVEFSTFTPGYTFDTCQILDDCYVYLHLDLCLLVLHIYASSIMLYYYGNLLCFEFYYW